LASMLKTLAAKHRSTVTKMAARYRAKIETSDGPRTCYEASKHRKGKKDLAARFGGITLRQDRRAVIRDQRIRRSRHDRGPRPSAMCPWAPGSGAAESTDGHGRRGWERLCRPSRPSSCL
jgi:hypothetical protein